MSCLVVSHPHNPAVHRTLRDKTTRPGVWTLPLMAAIVSNETRSVGEVDGPVWVESGRIDRTELCIAVLAGFLLDAEYRDRHEETTLISCG